MKIRSAIMISGALALMLVSGCQSSPEPESAPTPAAGQSGTAEASEPEYSADLELTVTFPDKTVYTSTDNGVTWTAGEKTRSCCFYVYSPTVDNSILAVPLSSWIIIEIQWNVDSTLFFHNAAESSFSYFADQVITCYLFDVTSFCCFLPELNSLLIFCTFERKKLAFCQFIFS